MNYLGILLLIRLIYYFLFKKIINKQVKRKKRTDEKFQIDFYWTNFLTVREVCNVTLKKNMQR